MVLTRDNLHNVGLTFQAYRKRGFTMIAAVDGPFKCETIDGNIASCENGFLGMDSQGYPYPIAAHVLEASYDKVEE